MMKFSAGTIASFTDKDSKIPKFRELYEHNDFLTAYSKHTDLRMQADPKWAIGRGDEWESHGKMQLEFLIQQGMKPHHKLLDFGCGPGRAARRFVPYLDENCYVGVDISEECIKHAIELSFAEGWSYRKPCFLINADLDLGLQFDYVFGHSVFTHLPEEQIERMIGNAANMLTAGGKMLFTFKRWNNSERTGLKQFRHAPAMFDRIAKSYCMKFAELPKIWPASQRTGMITRAA